MSCDTIRPLLEDFADGELTSEARETVTRHLDGCVTCHEEVQKLLTLAADARSALGSVEPARDLWPGITAHIGASRRFGSEPPRRSAWWLAAAALLGVALGVALMLPRQQAETVAARPRVAAESLDVTLAGWEEEVRQHRTALLASLDGQRDRLPAESIRAVEENLHLIDDAIREIRDALERDPDNPQLNFLLADAYQQEVQLLKRLSNV